MHALPRRTFLQTTALFGVSTSLSFADSPTEKITVAVIGTGGRGTELAKTFAKQTDVTVSHVCDVDQQRVSKAASEVEKTVQKTPATEKDFRRLLDDKSIDAVVIATCNHWHAPMAILAACAGKHVYVEKPCSHNPREGELMVEAAQKHKRQMQMGNQRRSWEKITEAMKALHEGVIGRVYLARSFYTNDRPSIGIGKADPVPMGLDYDLWQGPAPRKPFRSNYLHYNWHWFWHWGNGELGNNGVHMIDLCRWGLQVEYPVRVTSSGGRYRFQDDQETPDTHTVSFDFADRKTITWEGLSCNQHPSGKGADVIFYGEKGSLMINGNGYTVHDVKGKEIQKATGTGGDVTHIQNFLNAIRGKTTLNSEIVQGHRSTLLCHLGNIAYRTNRTLHCDPKDGKIINDAEAMKLWSREYEKGFEPKVS